MAEGFDVVIVNDRAFPGGGASKVALQSALGLAKRGHRVSLVSAVGPPSPDLAAAGIELCLLNQRDLASGPRVHMALQGLWNTEASRRLADHLADRRRGRTVVHVHSWSKALSASVFSAAARSGHPVAATLHDYGFVCPNAALHDYRAGVSCERKPMSLSCLARHCDAQHAAHKVWRVGRQLALKHIARAPDRLDLAICVSAYSHDILRPLMPSRLRSRVVLNPIDVEDCGPGRPAVSRNFIYVGRLSREKGVLLAAEAAKRAGVPLILVGDGELRGEIGRINSDATFTGWLPPSEVHALIRQSRALVFPPLWRETQGMVLPEAFGCGTPVIASSGTAPGAAITPGVTGLIFPNGDVEALAAILLRVAKDDALVEALGAAAYAEYWRAPATLGRHIDALEEAYNDLLT